MRCSKIKKSCERVRHLEIKKTGKGWIIQKINRTCKRLRRRKKCLLLKQFDDARSYKRRCCMFDYKTMIKLITRFSFFSYKNDNISVKPNKSAIIVYIYIYIDDMVFWDYVNYLNGRYLYLLRNNQPKYG